MQSYTQLYRALQSYTGLYTAIQRYTQLYRARQSDTELYTAIESYTQLYRAISSYTGVYTAIQNYTQLCRFIHSYTELYRAIQGYTELDTAVQSYTQQYRGAIHSATGLYTANYNNNIIHITLGQIIKSNTRYFPFVFLFSFTLFLQPLCISLVPLIFPYSAKILLENALFCRQNAQLENRLFFSKFYLQNLPKPTAQWLECLP